MDEQEAQYSTRLFLNHSTHCARVDDISEFHLVQNYSEDEGEKGEKMEGHCKGE